MPSRHPSFGFSVKCSLARYKGLSLYFETYSLHCDLSYYLRNMCQLWSPYYLIHVVTDEWASFVVTGRSHSSFWVSPATLFLKHVKPKFFPVSQSVWEAVLYYTLGSFSKVEEKVIQPVHAGKWSFSTAVSSVLGYEEPLWHLCHSPYSGGSTYSPWPSSGMSVPESQIPSAWKYVRSSTQLSSKGRGCEPPSRHLWIFTNMQQKSPASVGGKTLGHQGEEGWICFCFV